MCEGNLREGASVLGPREPGLVDCSCGHVGDTTAVCAIHRPHLFPRMLGPVSFYSWGQVDTHLGSMCGSCCPKKLEVGHCHLKLRASAGEGGGPASGLGMLPCSQLCTHSSTRAEMTSMGKSPRRSCWISSNITNCLWSSSSLSRCVVMGSCWGHGANAVCRQASQSLLVCDRRPLRFLEARSRPTSCCFCRRACLTTMGN